MSEKPGFTKGPWSVVEEKPTAYETYSDDGGFRIDAVGIEQLAYVWNASRRIHPDSRKQEDGDPFGDANARANAHLIAAAPELYAALKTALVHLHDIDSARQCEAEEKGERYFGLPELGQAEDALIKAEGRR